MSVKSFRALVGVPPSSATPQDSALIIIDAQNEYADGALKTANVASTRTAIRMLLQTYRAAGNPSHIIHVTHQTPAGAPVFTQGTPLADEFAELTPEAGESVVVKQHPGSFTGTNLDKLIEGAGVQQVVLVGYMAHVCVSTTARQAAERGLDVVLAREAIGDRDIPGASGEEATASALRELGDAFGTVVSVGDIK